MNLPPQRCKDSHGQDALITDAFAFAALPAALPLTVLLMIAKLPALKMLSP
jgi:hypothetical protein